MSKWPIHRFWRELGHSVCIFFCTTVSYPGLYTDAGLKMTTFQKLSWTYMSLQVYDRLSIHYYISKTHAWDNWIWQELTSTFDMLASTTAKDSGQDVGWLEESRNIQIADKKAIEKLDMRTSRPLPFLSNCWGNVCHAIVALMIYSRISS